jgi:SPOR domain
MDDTRFRSDRGGDPPYPAEEEYQDSDVPNYAAEEHYQDNEVQRARRHGLALVMAIFGLALVGSACAVGYRNMFVGSVSPTLPPAIKAFNTIASVSEQQAESSGDGRQIGPATTGSIGTMASREEQPATIGRPKAAPGASLPRASVLATPAAGQAVPNQAPPRAAVADPPAAPASIAAAPQRAGRSDGGDVTAAPNHEHLAAVPVAQANVDSRAAVSAPVVASGYAVQVTSERSESRAQAAFRALKAKYPNQLSGHQPIIRRTDLGAAGIYYRALVGPFASAEKAAKMCSGLKAAGGDCIIQKN